MHPSDGYNNFAAYATAVMPPTRIYLHSNDDEALHPPPPGPLGRFLNEHE